MTVTEDLLMDQQRLSSAQFGSSAANYLSSAVHANGADLVRLEAIAHLRPPARALDLGCGAGHVSFALARGGAQRVTAYDPSTEMLAVVANEAAARGHGRIETHAGAAEALPFESGTFDLIVSRYSAHHWADVPRALSECARVAAPWCRLILIDVIAPEVPLFDTALQVVEFLRDASHVRDCRVSEWRSMLKAAGFAEPAVDCWKLPLDFDSWIARIRTPPDRVAALRSVFAMLPVEVKQYFNVDANLNFETDSAWLEAPLH
jgi:ubiquinone/menaquinone biosynthesis C-methylase UbiE